MRYEDAAALVFNEYANSVEKHGDWSTYTLEQMMSVIIHELMVEAGGAEQVGDIHGDHGVIRELAQVAACCMKTIIVISSRTITASSGASLLPPNPPSIIEYPVNSHEEVTV